MSKTARQRSRTFLGGKVPGSLRLSERELGMMDTGLCLSFMKGHYTVGSRSVWATEETLHPQCKSRKPKPMQKRTRGETAKRKEGKQLSQ